PSASAGCLHASPEQPAGLHKVQRKAEEDRRPRPQGATKALQPSRGALDDVNRVQRPQRIGAPCRLPQLDQGRNDQKPRARLKQGREDYKIVSPIVHEKLETCKQVTAAVPRAGGLLPAPPQPAPSYSPALPSDLNSGKPRRALSRPITSHPRVFQDSPSVLNPLHRRQKALRDEREQVARQRQAEEKRLRFLRS
ncbi:MAG: hypothetical protein SGPRY_005698, partial [Prymnesium sp.]